MSAARIAVVTGTRADYGLLRPVLRGLADDSRFALQILATGAHLSPEFGRTVEVIADDGFEVTAQVEMLLSSDTPVGITKSLGLGTIGMADALSTLAPDLLLVLGDRYEVLAAVQAALVARIPVAHLSGGDVTEGAIDDAIRHAITKMSHLHLATNAESAARIVQMGEDPAHVHVTGNPGLDDLVRLEPMDRAALEADLGLRWRPHNLLVTYHPVTLADEPAEAAFGELLAALDALGDDVGIVLTCPNADTFGRVLLRMCREFAAARPNVVCHDSLGQRRYWSCLKHVDAVVGNSSSGLSEAPAVGVPAVNVGMRQGGRLRAASTIDVPPERAEILAGIRRALEQRDVAPSSPYGDGRATERILEVLAAAQPFDALLVKRFHPLEGDA